MVHTNSRIKVKTWHEIHYSITNKYLFKERPDIWNILENHYAQASEIPSKHCTSKVKLMSDSEAFFETFHEAIKHKPIIFVRTDY